MPYIEFKNAVLSMQTKYLYPHISAYPEGAPTFRNAQATGVWGRAAICVDQSQID
jgi:hypothetical protein